MKEKINALKAEIYDRLILQQQYKNAINQLQSQIEAFSKKIPELEKQEKGEEYGMPEIKSNIEEIN